MSALVCGSVKLTRHSSGPLPHLATHQDTFVGGRVGERAGAEPELPLQRSRGAIGAKFRLHGRSVAGGLDCVGLAGLVYGVAVPRGYCLRSGDAEAVVAGVAAAGLVRVADRRAGDLVLFRAGPGQLHLGIDGGESVIHADASLRRVVERPGLAPWPELMRWRA